jgi:hypothetical protein
LIFDSPMSDKNGWTTDGGPWSIVSDATAAKSPPSVAVQNYPSGMRDGGSPAIVERGMGNRYGTIYNAYWVKLSTSWYGHPGSAVNKVMHYWIAGDNRVYSLARGSGSEPLRWEIAIQGGDNVSAAASQGAYVNGHEANLAPNMNVSAGAAVRGRWYRIENVISNTTIDWWVDGVQVGHYTGLQLAPAGSLWQTWQWSPTWGGNDGATLPAAQSMWLDHVYLSGKP